MNALSRTPNPRQPAYARRSSKQTAVAEQVVRLWQVALRPALQQGSAVVWRYLQQGGQVALLKKRNRRLRVTETLSLGDKRFVSILEVDGQSFLVGSSNSGVALLASLTPERSLPFQQVFEDSLRQNEVQ